MPRFTLAFLCGVNAVLAANDCFAAGTDDCEAHPRRASRCETKTGPSSPFALPRGPMLNTLANHAHLPHDGKNIDVATLVAGLHAALNLDSTAQSFFTTQGGKALTTSSTGNASTFHLDDLKTHDVIEHDGSLSRADEAQGDSRTFNSTIFDETKSYWPDAAVITTSQAATALRKRIETQRAANPAFDMPAAQYTNAIGQTAMYLGVFGDYGEGDASRDYVEFFFENEKLPSELGWTRRTDDNQVTAAGR